MKLNSRKERSSRFLERISIKGRPKFKTQLRFYNSELNINDLFEGLRIHYSVTKTLEEIVNSNPLVLDQIELISFYEEAQFYDFLNNYLLYRHNPIFRFGQLLDKDSDGFRSSRKKEEKALMSKYQKLKKSLKLIAERNDLFSNLRLVENIIFMEGSEAPDAKNYLEKTKSILDNLSYLDPNYAIGLLQYFFGSPSREELTLETRGEAFDKIFIDLMDKSLEGNPSNPLILATKGFVLYEYGHKQKAEETWTELIRMMVDDRKIQPLLKRTGETRNIVYQVDHSPEFPWTRFMVVKQYSEKKVRDKEESLLRLLNEPDGFFPVPRVLGSFDLSSSYYLAQLYEFDETFADTIARDNPSIQSFHELQEKKFTLEEIARVLAFLHHSEKLLSRPIDRIQLEEYNLESELRKRFLKRVQTPSQTELKFIKDFQDFESEIKERNSRLPSVILHGDFTPFNISVPKDRVYGLDGRVGIFDLEKVAIGNPLLDLSALLAFPIFYENDKNFLVDSYIFYSAILLENVQEQFKWFTRAQLEEKITNLSRDTIDFYGLKSKEIKAIKRVLKNFPSCEKINLEDYLKRAGIYSKSHFLSCSIKSLLKQDSHLFERDIPSNEYRTAILESLRDYEIFSGICFFGSSMEYKHMQSYAIPILAKTLYRMNSFGLSNLRASLINCILEGKNEPMKKALSNTTY